MKINKFVVGVALSLTLVACGQKPTPISASPSAQSAAAATDPLRVVSFNEQSTTAGKPFNLQADGNSGITFELNRPASGAEIKAWFNNKPLTGVVSRDMVITATIPAEYLQTAGEYPIELEVSTESARVPVGNFIVKAP